MKTETIFVLLEKARG